MSRGLDDLPGLDGRHNVVEVRHALRRIPLGTVELPNAIRPELTHRPRRRRQFQRRGISEEVRRDDAIIRHRHDGASGDVNDRRPVAAIRVADPPVAEFDGMRDPVFIGLAHPRFKSLRIQTVFGIQKFEPEGDLLTLIERVGVEGKVPVSRYVAHRSAAVR